MHGPDGPIDEDELEAAVAVAPLVVDDGKLLAITVGDGRTMAGDDGPVFTAEKDGRDPFWSEMVVADHLSVEETFGVNATFFGESRLL